MPCSKYHEWMMQHLDGELPSHLVDELNDHMAECRICSEEWRQIHFTVASVRSLPVVPTPDGLTQATLERIRSWKAQTTAAGHGEVITLQEGANDSENDARASIEEPGYGQENGEATLDANTINPEREQARLRQTKRPGGRVPYFRGQPLWLGVTAACLLVFVMSSWWTWDGLRPRRGLEPITFHMEVSSQDNAAEGIVASAPAADTAQATAEDVDRWDGTEDGERGSASSDEPKSDAQDVVAPMLFSSPEDGNVPPDTNAGEGAMDAQAFSAPGADDPLAGDSDATRAAGRSSEPETQRDLSAGAGLQAAPAWPVRLFISLSAFGLGLLAFRRWRMT